MKLFSTFINEAPVADIQRVGDFERNSSIRRPADRNFVSKPKLVDKLSRSFGSVDQDLYLYFVNTPKANKHTEVGMVDQLLQNAQGHILVM